MWVLGIQTRSSARAVCMYVYMFVCAYLPISLPIYPCMYLFIYVCTYPHIYLCVCIHTCIYHVHMYEFTYLSVHLGGAGDKLEAFCC